MKELIYKIIDLITGGGGLTKTINGITLRLPTRYINYFPKDYEKENFSFLEQECKKGNVVLDIGAHIGLFATAASKTVGNSGKIFAFEPAPQSYKLLQKTIAINKMGSIIEARNEAIGNAIGKTTFFISDIEGDNSNSLVSYKVDRHLHGIDIVVSTIDSFIEVKKLPLVRFIKIDVEGGEYDVLQGATGTFAQSRPAVILAIHPEAIKAKGDRLEDIYDLIVKNKYIITYQQAELSKEKFCNNMELIDLHLLPQKI